MIEAWLIYDKEGAKRNSDYIKYHDEAGAVMGIHFTLKMAEDMEKIIEEPYPKFAIVRTISPLLSKQLERCGIPVFNCSFVSEICNDKGRTTKYIKEHTTVPIVETNCFSFSVLTKALLQQFPSHVIKAVDGHGGKQVFQTSDDFKQIKNAISDSDFIIQPFIVGPGKDVRVYVIGSEVVGAVERTSRDGFKSNYSLGGQVNNYVLSSQEEDYVRQICNVFDFGMVGIDFIVDAKGDFIFNEIEDVVGARMLYQCQPNCNLLEKYLAYILDKIIASETINEI